MTRESAGSYDAFAVAAPGLESVVARELSDLGVQGLDVINGGVEFTASQRQLYEANLRLRTASRVLVRLAEFRALTFADLERRAKRIPWDRVIARGDPVALRVTCRKSRLYHSGAVAERVARDLVARMGAEVDSARDDEDNDPATEAQLIVVRIERDRCTVSADSSGAHLHQRGYRTSVTQAPMRETLAAALVIASGWDCRSPLLDPFCGSGTIAMEAALMAARIAPGINRKFRFMRWPDYDRHEWERVWSASRGREKRGAIPSIMASDRSAAAVRATRDNAGRAGVADFVQVEKLDFSHTRPAANRGWVISNPPYGVRLGDAGETRRLLSTFGEHLRRDFGGWHLALLAPSDVQRTLRIPMDARIRTTNGGLRVNILAGQIPIGSESR